MGVSAVSSPVLLGIGGYTAVTVKGFLRIVKAGFFRQFPGAYTLLFAFTPRVSGGWDATMTVSVTAHHWAWWVCIRTAGGE